MANVVNITWLANQFPDISGLKPLGRGGQKVVFIGKHNNHGEIVLKIYQPHSDEKRVLREVQAIRTIQSPRIPRIFDIGSMTNPMGEEVIWIYEQLIPGKNLREVINKGPLSAGSVLVLAVQMLEALVAAENSRIVHRDVKPENIVASDDGTYWLLDFGLSRHLDLESITPTGPNYGVGTPGYAPTEQFHNTKLQIDARTDLFSLGVTLYECVEGVNPYTNGARDIVRVLQRVETIPLPAISRQVDKEGEFKELVLAMTRTQPNHRLAQAADALKWMQEIFDKENP